MAINQIAARPTFFPARMSSYVPNMSYDATVNMRGISRVDFGTPLALSAAGVVGATSIASAVSLLASAGQLLVTELDGLWGRNVTVVADGAATSLISVFGWDYMQQPIAELLTLNGATPVIGVKCFKYLKSVSYAATAGRTATVGWGASLGLPFKAVKAFSEELEGAPATLGTLVAPVLTAGTSTSSDPRGRYNYTSTLTGVARLSATFLFDNSTDSVVGGGLHGMPHYSA